MKEGPVMSNILKKLCVSAASLAMIMPMAGTAVSANAKPEQNGIIQQVNRKYHTSMTHRHHVSKGKKLSTAQQLARDNSTIASLKQQVRYYKKLLSRHAHKYYKFAYNKKEYRLAYKHISNSTYHYILISRKLASSEPRSTNRRIFQKGVFDSYADKFNKKLGNNHSYYRGYVRGTRKASGYTMTWKECAQGYNDDKKEGVGQLDYISYFKQRAHNNML